MTMTDPIADMLTRVRNGNKAYHDSVRMPYSRSRRTLLKSSSRRATSRPGRARVKASSECSSSTQVRAERERTIAGIRRISKPGLRVYAKATNLPKVLGGSEWPSSAHRPACSLISRLQSGAWAGKSSPSSGRRSCHVSPAPGHHPSWRRDNPCGQRCDGQGPKGTLSHTIINHHGGPGGRNAVSERPDDERESRARHGLTRSLLATWLPA